VLASLHNRNAILVELEKKFVDWMYQAKEKVETMPTLAPKGEIRVIKGDSRKLSELLKNGQTDTIITSPPYTNSAAENLNVSRYRKGGKFAEEKLEEVGTIITSPPYAEANRGGGIAQKGYDGKYGKDEKLHLRHDRPLSNNPDNIGNMKKETYLQAMLQVYKEMYSVLKEGGRAIVVIKPFTRNKKVVDLPYQTWLLLQKAGFQLEDVFKLRLDKLSFWRILQYKKNPEQEQIRHEYILVVRK
jgi:DNA modification methylase